MINLQRAKLLGIRIEKIDETPVVFSEKPLHEVTKRELIYLLGVDAEFSVDTQFTDQNFITAKSETKTINLAFDKLLSKNELQRAAAVALNSKDNDDIPAVKLFDNVLSVAIARGASDVHITPKNDLLHLKMRFDGILSDYATFDVRVAPMLSARIKLLSGMDITERRSPQDGKFSVQFNGRIIDIRTATMPVTNGERLALRIFNQNSNLLSLEQLDLSAKHREALRKVIFKNHGLVLVCGPTGSGKTTTIYSMLNELRDRGQNIMTIEDPIEMDLEQVVQTQVDENSNFSFASGLKALMRNDPDIIMIGEIRDPETAQTAVRAAMTGHLVISTVHANNPVGAIKRLINLGVDPTLISDCLLGVFNQRLVKIYCNECVNISYNDTACSSNPITEHEGCESCFFTGFKSRRPVMSHLLVDIENSRLIETDLSKIQFDNDMINEAEEMFKAKLIPHYELEKLREI